MEKFLSLILFVSICHLSEGQSLELLLHPIGSTELVPYGYVLPTKKLSKILDSLDIETIELTYSNPRTKKPLGAGDTYTLKNGKITKFISEQGNQCVKYIYNSYGHLVRIESYTADCEHLFEMTTFQYDSSGIPISENAIRPISKSEYGDALNFAHHNEKLIRSSNYSYQFYRNFINADGTLDSIFSISTNCEMDYEITLYPSYKFYKTISNDTLYVERKYQDCFGHFTRTIKSYESGDSTFIEIAGDDGSLESRVYVNDLPKTIQYGRSGSYHYEHKYTNQLLPDETYGTQVCADGDLIIKYRYIMARKKRKRR